MSEFLFHRGPDGTGAYADDHVALAMRRLSIIDLAGGWQPLYNEDCNLVLFANGEIYNYIELRKALLTQGHDFKTGSDCEVIIHLYEEYGLDFVQHLRGMFVFALWDVSGRRLILSRDRMGEKPLYYYIRGTALIFSSEMKSLLASGYVPFKLNSKAVNNYFHYSWIPEPETIIQGVGKLDAAEMMVLDVDSWKISKNYYWRMEDSPILSGDPIEAIEAELRAVSDLVIRSNVPVGVALSGGIDSSAVAALAERAYPETLHAFSVGYVGRPPCDERANALVMAKHLGIPFHEVEIDAFDMVAFFPELVYWRDDPIADISGYAYYAVMRSAHEHGVSVMLQGQGGDELFWGYEWVNTAARKTEKMLNVQGYSYLGLLKASLRDTGNAKISSDSSFFFKYYSYLNNVRKSIAENHKLSVHSAQQAYLYDLTPDYQQAVCDIHGLYGKFLREATQNHIPSHLFELPKPHANLDIFFTRLMCDTYLRCNGVVQGDRLGMASSVELRLPLLDHKLVETIIGFRKQMSDRDFESKGWLRNAVNKIIPQEIMQRPKRGFAPPVKDWYAMLFKQYGEMLDKGQLVRLGVLSEDGGRSLAHGICPPGTVHPLSFKALVLELWIRKMQECVMEKK